MVFYGSFLRDLKKVITETEATHLQKIALLITIGSRGFYIIILPPPLQ